MGLLCSRTADARLTPSRGVLFFWFTLLFDLPRYILSTIAMACVPWQSPPPKRYSTSAIVAGHNEAKTVRLCIRSLEVDEIIVVNDGSTDDMWVEVQQQLMWIEFDPGVTPPPYFTKVTIS